MPSINQVISQSSVLRLLSSYWNAHGKHVSCSIFYQYFYCLFWPVFNTPIPLSDYSATEYKNSDDWAPGRMNLHSLGLNLEADITDEDADIRAFVASNFRAQIDGEEDSIIVIGFRGTASTTNVLTDLKFKQVCSHHI